MHGSAWVSNAIAVRQHGRGREPRERAVGVSAVIGGAQE